ncbi:unnamed protein product [Linum trigynum]
MTNSGKDGKNLVTMMSFMIRHAFGRLNFIPRRLSSSIETYSHVLGLAHCNWLTHKPNDLVNRDTVRNNNALYKWIPCATRLKEFGVAFERMEETNLFDAKYKGGVLRMPGLIINDDSETLLRNLMAYEKLRLPEEGLKYASEYILLLSCLVNSEEDVKLLSRCGILVNKLDKTKDKVVLRLIRRLEHSNSCAQVCFYSNIFEEINQRIQNRRHRWMRAIRKNVFKDPWHVIAFMVGVLLFMMQVFQLVLLPVWLGFSK